MSELKSYDLVDIQDYRGEVYLKYEADKYIDVLKNEIEVQKQLRNMALASVPNALKVMRIIQHKKYKRCLAMARIAQDDWHLHNSFYAMWHQEFEKRKCEFYEKWRKRWLELAEQFKEEN